MLDNLVLKNLVGTQSKGILESSTHWNKRHKGSILINNEHMKNFKYHVIFRPEPEGGFTAIVPSLPGCVTYGTNILEAQKMVLDAINGYIESLRKHHEPVPSDDISFISLVDIDVPNPKNFNAKTARY